MSGGSEQSERMARLFDALSGSYDAVGVDFFGPIAGGLLEALAPQPGERWLDVGCGRGAVLLPAAAAVGPAGHVTGIDISPGMVEQARSLARDAGLENVAVEVGDAVAPDVDGGFDVVASSLVVFFLPDPGAALRAWHPLLAPGGRLGVTTFGPVDPRWSYVDEVFAPYLPPAMRDARTTGRAGPFASDEGVEQLVTDAGYAEARTVNATIPVRFADADQWHAFTWSTGQRAMWLAIPEHERPAVRAEAERRLAENADPDGSITVTQSVRHTLARQPG
jgi:ubiquinone/menaquinone biosynthesis C-methylase UbiE